LYNSSWDNPLTNTSETGGTTEKLAQQYVQEIKHWIGWADWKDRAVLDYGAGRGNLLRAWGLEVRSAVGVEPYGFASLSSQGLKVYQWISDLPKNTKFDLIYSKDVIEHLVNPVEEIKALKSKLKHGGWLILMTANVASIRSRLQRGNWKELRKEGHLILFTPRSLEGLLRSCGLRAERLHFRINFGGSWTKQIASTMMKKMGVDGELQYACRVD
jgi:2-polyprenyl-3-methyl-5-hydroxy-6-metoxy-1,4-benzoquinol methylase